MVGWEHAKRRGALAGCFQRAGFPEGEPGPRAGARRLGRELAAGLLVLFRC